MKIAAAAVVSVPLAAAAAVAPPLYTLTETVSLPGALK
jgi:hypothetical protein